MANVFRTRTLLLNGVDLSTLIASTGQQSYNTSISIGSNLSGNISQTGVYLINRENLISGFLYTGISNTGSNLYNTIIGLSGQSNINYATINNLQQTGIALESNIISLSGFLTDSYLTGLVAGTNITINNNNNGTFTISGVGGSGGTNLSVSGSNSLPAANLSGAGSVSIIQNGSNILISGSQQQSVSLPTKFIVTLDFGYSSGGQGDMASITLSGVSGNFVNNSTVINCWPMGANTLNHSPDDVWAENIQAYASNIVTGSSFDVVAYAPNGTFGQYQIGVICY